MKYLALILFLPTMVLAHGPHRKMASALKIIENPFVEASKECSDGETQGWCEDLGANVCVDPTPLIDLSTMSLNLLSKHTKSVPPSAPYHSYAVAHLNAVREAEAKASELSGVTKEDLSGLTSELKASLVRQIGASPVPADKQKEMKNKVAAITFKTATELIDGEKARLVSEGLSETDAFEEAYIYYSDVCGEAGLEVNAFYDTGSNSFVVCPGLLHSVQNMKGGGNKEDNLKSLEFVVAHELSHSIDGVEYLSSVPPIDRSIYDQMEPCHQTENPSMNWEAQRGEIISDFWAVQVLADRYSSQNLLGEEVRDRIAQSANSIDLCSGAGDVSHPGGQYRLNAVFSRDPGIRARLECGEPTPEKPYCGIKGAQPPRPSSAE